MSENGKKNVCQDDDVCPQAKKDIQKIFPIRKEKKKPERNIEF